MLAPGTGRVSARYAQDDQGWRVFPIATAEASATVTAGPLTTPTLSTTLSAASITLADPLLVSVTVVPIAALRQAFAPDFALQRVTGIGIAVPPSYVRLSAALLFHGVGFH